MNPGIVENDDGWQRLGDLSVGKSVAMFSRVGRNVGSQKHKTRKARSRAGLRVTTGGEGGIRTRGGGLPHARFPGV